MALTDIAKKLKETFEEEFGGSALHEEVKIFSEKYGGKAESIRIGDMDYIVINEEYKRKEYDNIPAGISPLFFNSINNNYAIIDSETSSTLIDEVYSRVTYMQKVCESTGTPNPDDIINCLRDYIGAEIENPLANVKNGGDAATMSTANIFQCQLIKDTGVSAAPDVYSFMLKNGEIREIGSNVMSQIRHMGTVEVMDNSNMLKTSGPAIQQAVFDKYINADIDIQSISVKSIFEITMPCSDIRLKFTDHEKRLGNYDTAYIAIAGDEFKTLNASILRCNSCGHEVVDVKDSTKVNKLHVNMDAYYDENVDPEKPVYAVGCESCLERCEECGGWHFNYATLDPAIYAKVKFAKGREFIRGLRSIDANYCTCREGIEWIYDEESGTETEHDVIDIRNIAFINSANEKLGTYEGFSKFYEKAKENYEKPKKDGEEPIKLKGSEECNFAKSMIAKYKVALAKKFEIDSRDIKITSVERCSICGICGGDYYCGNNSFVLEEYRCDACDELIADKRTMVTRADGMIFMRARGARKGGYTVNKYVMTKFGNLRLFSNKKLETETVTQEEQTGGEIVTVVSEE